MKTLKILDLFSGIGTFSYAFDQVKYGGERLFETVAFCEIDKDAQRILRKHWPEVPIFTDVSQVHLTDGCLMQEDRSEVGYVDGNIDIIVGGFPCTDISVAGKQKGLVDEHGNKTRSGLWTEYKRLIKEIKPKYVIIENVRALLSNGIGTVLKDLSEIGYDAEWEVISARDVGQCHLRERIWIVAYPSSQRRQQISRSSHENERENEGRPENENNLATSNGESDSSEQVSREVADTTDTDYFRFWPAFTTEEEKLKWWTEATAEFRDWRKAQPELCGVYDGPTTGLHEKFRRGRIKQLGNGIVRTIAQLHAERIKYHETIALEAL